MSLVETGKVFLAASILYGCALFAEESGSDMDSSLKYYRSFAGYSIPLRLVDAISKEEASELTGYLVAKLNRDGRVSTIVKILNERQSFRHEYEYFVNGNLRRVRIWREDGSETVQEYDISGTLQVPTKTP